MTGILDTFSARQAAAYVGFGSVAMIDYLQRSGVFFPRKPKGRRGRGRERKYEFRDLLVLKALKRLLDSGASVAMLRDSLRTFQKWSWKADPGMLEDPKGIVRYLVASAAGVHLARNADEIIDLSRNGQLVFSFIIDLDALHGELCASLGLPELQPELTFSPIDRTTSIAVTAVAGDKR